MTDTKSIVAVAGLLAVFGVVMGAMAMAPAEAQVTADTEVDTTEIHGESLYGVVDNATASVSGTIEWEAVSNGADFAVIEVHQEGVDEPVGGRTIDLDGTQTGDRYFQGVGFRITDENGEKFHNEEDATTKEHTVNYEVVVKIQSDDRHVAEFTDQQQVTVEVTNMGGPDYVPSGSVDTDLDASIEMVPPEEVSEEWKTNQERPSRS